MFSFVVVILFQEEGVYYSQCFVSLSCLQNILIIRTFSHIAITALDRISDTLQLSQTFDTFLNLISYFKTISCSCRVLRNLQSKAFRRFCFRNCQDTVRTSFNPSRLRERMQIVETISCYRQRILVEVSVTHVRIRDVLNRSDVLEIFNGQTKYFTIIRCNISIFIFNQLDCCGIFRELTVSQSNS